MKLIQSLRSLESLLASPLGKSAKRTESRERYSIEFFPALEQLSETLRVVDDLDGPVLLTLFVMLDSQSFEFSRVDASRMKPKGQLDLTNVDGAGDDADHAAFTSLARIVKSGQEVAPDAICGLLQRIAPSGVDLTMRVRVVVTKRDKSSNECEYIFASTSCLLEQLLKDIADFKIFESTWRPAVASRTRVRVLDLNEPCHFLAFSFIGTDSDEPAAELDETEVKRLDAMRSMMQKEVNWPARPTRLTPSCLAEKDVQHDEIAKAFSLIRERLALHYLPTAILPQEAGGAKMYFTGSDKGYFVGAEKQLPKNSSGLFPLCEWAYDSAANDRLLVVRRLVAPQLSDASDFLNELAIAAPSLLEKAKTALAEQQITNLETYFKKRKDIDDAVTKYVQDSHKDVLGLVKDTTDSFYKTIGVFVGASILVVLKESLNAKDNSSASYADIVYVFSAIASLIYILAALFHLSVMNDIEKKKLAATRLRIEDSDLLEEHKKKHRDDVDAGELLFGKRLKQVRFGYFAILILTALMFAGSRFYHPIVSYVSPPVQPAAPATSSMPSYAPTVKRGQSPRLMPTHVVK